MTQIFLCNGSQFPLLYYKSSVFYLFRLWKHDHSPMLLCSLDFVSYHTKFQRSLNKRILLLLFGKNIYQHLLRLSYILILHYLGISFNNALLQSDVLNLCFFIVRKDWEFPRHIFITVFTTQIFRFTSKFYFCLCYFASF